MNDLAEKKILDWQLKIASMLPAAFNGGSVQYKVFVLLYAARYFFLRGKSNVAIELTTQALQGIPLNSRLWDYAINNRERYISLKKTDILSFWAELQ